MYTSTFIFDAKPFDDEFHRFNDEIAERARAIPGFLGMGVHKEAKSVREKWIESYRVVIAEVLSTYGQAGLGLEHVPHAPSRG